MNTTIQKVCAYSGLVGLTVFFFAFWPTSGFMPPPGPDMTAAQVALMYQQNTFGIRIGTVFMFLSVIFMPPLVAIISLQMRRMKTSNAQLLSYIQLSSGTLGLVFFIVPPVFFFVTAFRPERPPEITQVMNDLSWIILILPWPTFFIQNLSIAAATFSDSRSEPIFPRWVAYLNLWVAIGFTPMTLLAFFKTGPFAWNGLFGFWLAAIVISIWFIGMCKALLRAIDLPSVESAHEGVSLHAEELRT